MRFESESSVSIQFLNFIEKNNIDDSKKFDNLMSSTQKINHKTYVMLVKCICHCRTQQIVQEIKVPASAVTAVEWGGKNLDKLFVLTASRAYDTQTGAVASTKFSADSGKVFVVTGLGATGVPQNTLDL